MANTVRTTISIPKSLKKRMDAAAEEFNWSAIAVKAFTRALDGPAPGADETFLRVIDRLEAATEPLDVLCPGDYECEVAIRNLAGVLEETLHWVRKGAGSDAGPDEFPDWGRDKLIDYIARHDARTGDPSSIVLLVKRVETAPYSALVARCREIAEEGTCPPNRS